MDKKKKILILYSGPHKLQMIALKKWLSQNLPDYDYKLSTQFWFAKRVKKYDPPCIITYNKNLIRTKNINAIKEYCDKGGKLIALHHNVSSMMMRQPEWLEMMKVKIEKGEKAEYPWSVIEGGDLYLTNLAPDSIITTNEIKYKDSVPAINLPIEPNKVVTTHELLTKDQKQEYHSREKEPAILFNKSEYFINHVLLPEPERTLLFALYFIDEASGREFISNNGGWKMPFGQGTIYYLMPGHSVHDYNDTYCKIIRNCIMD
ncbi:MAG: hypothetical protein GF364_08230 [Candidatus Lokiarchaeota archaeon]|nr:hypothetical protein [Candidatus Lokiarchaeota archaeon]